MTPQVIIGYTTEGSTDVLFLKSVVQRTFEHIAFECHGQIEILPVQNIDRLSGDFIEAIIKCSVDADNRGVTVLCVHVDADSENDANALANKINPAFDAICKLDDENVCKNLVAIVPVHMTEAWMLSDIELLKREIGTNENCRALGLDRPPETIRNPKQAIEDAIRIARQGLPKRRRSKLSISDLYSPLGQKMPIDALDRLSSYQKFCEAVRIAFDKLGHRMN